MCSRLCSEVNGRLGEIQRDFIRYFKKRLHPSFQKDSTRHFPMGNATLLSEEGLQAPSLRELSAAG